MMMMMMMMILLNCEYQQYAYVSKVTYKNKHITVISPVCKLTSMCHFTIIPRITHGSFLTIKSQTTFCSRSYVTHAFEYHTTEVHRGHEAKAE
jgi:hypothetical protein